MASIRARPTATPLATAQAAASAIDTSGCSGLLGGSLPVESFHVAVIALRATMVAPTVAARPNSVQTFEPEAICVSFVCSDQCAGRRRGTRTHPAGWSTPPDVLSRR